MNIGEDIDFIRQVIATFNDSKTPMNDVFVIQHILTGYRDSERIDSNGKYIFHH